MTTLDDPTTTPTVDTIRDNLRAWALHLAARGWHVFPIAPGAKKPPAITRWENRASTDSDQITRWWRHPAFTIGIATGPSGLVVVDLDTAKPGETAPDRWATLGIGSGAGVLRALVRRQGTTVTPTYAVRTTSGGWHLYYTAPAGTQLRNTQAVLGWKVDTRAHGGYVVAPGCPVPPGWIRTRRRPRPCRTARLVTPGPHPQTTYGALSARGGRRCQPQRLRLHRCAGRGPASADGAIRPAQRRAAPPTPSASSSAPGYLTRTSPGPNSPPPPTCSSAATAVARPVR